MVIRNLNSAGFFPRSGVLVLFEVRRIKVQMCHDKHGRKAEHAHKKH
jgi:hypothetical protein